jgi:hypothetical protein
LWLVLCHEDDECAFWLAEGLRKRGFGPLRLVTAESLGPGSRWVHRIEAEGPSISVELPDGHLINSDGVRGVINRLSRPCWLLSASLVKEDDRDYAEQEVAAFFVSWLSSFKGHIVNRPSPLGLSGRMRRPSEWIVLASSCGLATVPYRRSSIVGGGWVAAEAERFSVLVVNGKIFGRAPDEIVRGCCRLAALSHTVVLGIEFALRARAGPVFVGATPIPDMRSYGGDALEALVHALIGPVAR